MKKLKLKEINRNWKVYALAGCVCILFAAIIFNLGQVLSGIGIFLGTFSTVFIGVVIAYILNPLAALFERALFKKIPNKKLGWILSVTLTMLVVAALFVLLLVMLIPQLIDNIASFTDNINLYIADLRARAESMNNIRGQVLDALVNYLDGENGIMTGMGDIIAKNLKRIISATSSVGSAAANWVIGIILAIYFLIAKDSIKAAFDKLIGLVLTPMHHYRTNMLLSKFHSIFSRYIVCELLDAMIVGICCFIFALITGMPSSWLISVIIGVTNLAPTFGPIVGAVIGGFILLLVKPSILFPFIIFILVLQTIDGYIIKPKLFGGALDVPGVVVLVFIIVFSKLMGITGMLISIPVSAIAVYLYTQTLIPWLQLRRDKRAYAREFGDLQKTSPVSPASENADPENAE